MVSDMKSIDIHGHQQHGSLDNNGKITGSMVCHFIILFHIALVNMTHEYKNNNPHPVYWKKLK